MVKKRMDSVKTELVQYVDNMTVVRRMGAFNAGEMLGPAQMLGPDIDVQLQIQENMDRIYKNFHVSITTLHVKGHQDRRKRVLSWPERLNVMVDELAEQESWGKIQKRVTSQLRLCHSG